MKSTGIVRRVDELGRIVLPIELRRSLNINEKDTLEIFVDDERIILKKYEPADIFTGSMDDLIEYKGKKVSKKSIIETTNSPTQEWTSRLLWKGGFTTSERSKDLLHDSADLCTSECRGRLPEQIEI